MKHLLWIPKKDQPLFTQYVWLNISTNKVKCKTSGTEIGLVNKGIGEGEVSTRAKVFLITEAFDL